MPSSQLEYALIGDSVTAWDTRVKMEVPVRKVWIGPERDSVTIILFADNTEIDRAELTAGTGWSHTFEGLVKFDPVDGHEIQYRIEEEPAEGYRPVYSGSAETGYTITNTNIETIDIPVTKKWVGTEGDEVTIRLYADGKEVRRLTLTKSEGWESAFSSLPVFDTSDGHRLEYTITEDAVAGYSSEVEGSAENGFTVTNTRKEPTPEPTPTPEPRAILHCGYCW